MKRSFRGHTALFLFAAVLLSQMGAIGPYDNVVTEGIPQIAVSLRRDVSRYGAYRTAELMAWNPVKQEMLIRTYGYGPRHRGQLHRVEYPGGRFRQLTFFNDPVAGTAYPPERDDYLVLRKDTDGNEQYRLYRCDSGMGKVTLLTDGRARITSWDWSHSSRQIAYLSTGRNGKVFDLHLMDPADPHSDRLLVSLGSEGWGVRCWSPDDRHIVLGQTVSNRESYLWLLDVATGVKQCLTPGDPAHPCAYRDAAFSGDGRGLYTLSNRGSEFWQLVYLDLATRRQRLVTRPFRWDVSSFALTRKRKMLAFVVNEDGASVLHLLDLSSGKERPVEQLPPGVISGLRWHQGTELGFTCESSHYQTDAYSLDVRTGRIKRWTDSQTRGLHPEVYAEPERIHWPGFDGRSISGLLYRPPPWFSGKRPVIIDIHGGPESQSRPEYIGVWNYYIDELGIALIRPNVRGSSGYGKTFLDLDNGFRREDAYRDIGSLLDWIRSSSDLDASRVMVTGASYGGNVALAAAAAYNDRIRCAMEISGPSNLVTFLISRERDREERRAEYGDERDPRMRAFLERIAPLNNARKIRKPLFIVQGANDPRVPLGEAQQMVEAVRRNGTPVWYLMAWNEGHGFFKPANVGLLSDARALFVKEYLLK
jgi:dipeptidyl aminopeptidase/acylaminoacyl peptidase